MSRNILLECRRVALAALLLLPLAMTGCHSGSEAWHGTDVSGSTPDLAFNLTRSSDGRDVSAADYRGKVTLLYFGYTYCPDVCPTTLANVAQALKQVGSASIDVRVLFVTVDTRRDTLPVLAQYVIVQPHVWKFTRAEFRHFGIPI